MTRKLISDSWAATTIAQLQNDLSRRIEDGEVDSLSGDKKFSLNLTSIISKKVHISTE